MPYTLAYATVLLVKSNHYDIEGMHGKNFILKYGYYHLTTHTHIKNLLLMGLYCNCSACF